MGDIDKWRRIVVEAMPLAREVDIDASRIEQDDYSRHTVHWIQGIKHVLKQYDNFSDSLTWENCCEQMIENVIAKLPVPMTPEADMFAKGVIQCLFGQGGIAPLAMWNYHYYKLKELVDIKRF